MLSTKPFQCPCCNYNFTSKDSIKGHSSSHFPLIIKCGHTVCESCVKNAAKVQKSILCSVCQCQTDFLEGEYSVAKLLPDFYVLGVLSANVRQIPHSIKLKMVPAGISKESENLRKKGKATVQCGECNQRLASWRCDKCEENFCNICFDQIHTKSIKAMRKHEGKPIYVEEYHSMVQQGCAEHSQRPIEFFCDDDNELACSYCVVMGKHKGHSVLTLYEKNKSCSGDLKKAVEEAQQVLRRMKFTENKLTQSVPTEKIDTTHLVKDIQNHFHRFHAMLQIRESELITQVETFGSSSVTALENMRQEVSDYQKEVVALLRDAEQSLKNPYLSVSATTIIKKLETTKNHSYHLVPIEMENDCTKGIDLVFEDDLDELIKKHGTVNADIKTRYCLKSFENLPESFVLETLPDDASVVTDSESLTSLSDNLSEDSLTIPRGNSVPIPVSFAIKQKQCSSLRQEMVIVSHIRHPGSFWVQRSSESRKLKTMSEAINKWCRNSESSKHIPTTVSKGDLYLVKYSLDKRWYRARIKKIVGIKEDETALDGEMDNSADDENSKEEIVGNKRIEVIYVDYGNTEIVVVSRLRNIQTRFLNLPGMAIECSLWDISPLQGDTWSNEAVKTFAQFVGNKQVYMQVIEQRNDIFYVDLSQPASNDISNDVPVSVRDALVFLELGCFISGTMLKCKRNKIARQFMPPEQLRANAEVNVILSHVESPSFFYVQQLSTARYLSDLIFEMQKAYNTEVSTLHNIYVPTIGMICAAQFSVDKQWYRAEVINLPGDSKIEVQYVDFGNKEIVRHSHLRKLLDHFIRLNKQAIPCCLADVNYNQQSSWSEEACKWLTNIAAKKQLVLKSHGIIPGEQKARVVLYDVQDDVEICINALIVKEGLASSCGPSSEVLRISRPLPASKVFKLEFSVPVVPSKSDTKETTEQNCDNSDNKEKTILKTVKPPQDFKNDLVPVHVSYVETPSLFYIRTATKEEDKLNGLMDELQQVYRQFEGEVTDLSENAICAIKNVKDNKWYRGSIMSKLDDNLVKVHFLDYGFNDTVSVKNLRMLLDRFRLDGAFAVACHLAGIHAAGDSKNWSQVACERFKELISEYDILYLTRKGDIEGRSLAADLLIEEICRGGALEPTTIKYKSIAEQLIEKGVALPTRGTKERAVTPKNSKVESTEISSVDVPVQAKKSVVFLPSKPNFQWKPPEYPKEQHFSAMPTFVGEDGCIFLHSLEKGACNIELIKKALQCKYSNVTYELLRIPPPVGQACVAKFSLDKKWYRAEVLSCYMDQVKVLFVDYGNSEIVPLEDIHTELIMADFPCQCLECELHGIKPVTKDGGWSTKVLDFIHDTIVEQKCMVDVMEPYEVGKKLKIMLTLPTGVEVTDLLKQMGEALSVNDPELSSGSGDTLLSLTTFQEPSVSSSGPFKKASKLKEKEPFSVCVTQLLEPNVVFLQQMKVLEPKSEMDKARNEELDKFLLLIEELSEKADRFPQVSYPEKGMACCARYTHDNNWYRCQITSVSEEGINVTYVDYGNSEVLPLDRLRILEDKFIDFPVQAHCCKLNGVEPLAGNWTTESLQAMVKKLFHNDEPMFARVIIQGEICGIDLLVKSEGSNSMELVYQSIAEQGIIKLNKHDQA